MSNTQVVPKSFLEAFKPVLAKIKKRYDCHQYHVPNFSGESLYSIAQSYYGEIAELGISDDEVKEHGLTVIDYERFSIHPPKTRDFALSLKKLCVNNAVDITQFDKSLVNLFEWLGRRYGGLWHSEEGKYSVIEDWQSFLSDIDCTSYNVDLVIKRIRNSSNHATYPPSSAEIEKYLRISSLDIDIPSASEAFLAISKCSSVEDMPLIVRYARRVFGSYSLRTRTDSLVRKDFISLYDAIVDDYIAGNIDLEKEFSRASSQKDKGAIGEPRMDKNALSKLISGM